MCHGADVMAQSGSHESGRVMEQISRERETLLKGCMSSNAVQGKGPSDMTVLPVSNSPLTHGCGVYKIGDVHPVLGECV